MHTLTWLETNAARDTRIEATLDALGTLIALAVRPETQNASDDRALLLELAQHESARGGLSLDSDLDELYAACTAALRAQLVHRPRQDAAALEEPAAHRLPSAEHARIFQRHVLPLLDAAPSERRALLLVGPAGAGLSALRVRLTGPASGLAISRARLCVYHPGYAELLETSDKNASACVAADAELWMQALLARAQAAGRSLVIEHSDPAADSCSALLGSLRGSGYAVDVRALAASDAMCLLGLHRRYEQLLADCGRGSFTLTAELVRAQRGLPVLLERLGREPSPAGVTVHSLDGAAHHVGGADAARMLRAEQARQPTAAEKAALAGGWLQVWAMKQARHAPRPDLEVVRTHKDRALRDAFTDEEATALLSQRLDARSFQAAAALADAAQHRAGN